MGTLRAVRLAGRRLRLDFRPCAAAQQIREGQGSLLTDGTRACMEASHLQYDQLLDAESGARGLRLLMDGDGITQATARRSPAGTWLRGRATATATSPGSRESRTRPEGASRHRTSSRASPPLSTGASRIMSWRGASRRTMAARCTCRIGLTRRCTARRVGCASTRQPASTSTRRAGVHRASTGW